MDNWLWPQWLMLTWFSLNLLLGAAYHDKPKKGNYSFIPTVVAVGISAWVLYSGGFFK